MTGRAPADLPLFTADDVERLGGIAGELEHAPIEIRRHFDQDGRDARFLRILQNRILEVATEVALPTIRIQSSPGRSGPYLLAGDGARVEDIVDRMRAGDSVESAAEDFGIPVEQAQLLCDVAEALADQLREAIRAEAKRLRGEARKHEQPTRYELQEAARRLADLSVDEAEEAGE